MVDIMCVGAHPDDIEIGMGATVAQLVDEGMTVAMVDLTDGEPTPAGSHDIRLAEATRSAEVLGVRQRITLAGSNRYLFDTVEARQQLAEVIRELRPRTIFAPYPQDAHPDHIAAASIVGAARFYAKLTKTDMSGEPHYPARIYHYMAVHMQLVREPSFALDVSATLDRKLQALECYRSQFIDNEKNLGMLVRVEQLARSWGQVIGTKAAEPFFAAEPPGLCSLRDLV